MNTKTFLRSGLYILWGVVLVCGVVYANNLIYPAISTKFLHIHPCVYDVFSDAVLLFIAFMPILWAPKFFGYQFGSITRYWKMLLGMATFVVGANTWFFEGVVVSLAEEGLRRGVLYGDLWEGNLPAGTYQVVLTSHQTPGSASVYIKTH